MSYSVRHITASHLRATTFRKSAVSAYVRSIPYKRIHTAVQDARPLQNRRFGLCLAPAGQVQKLPFSYIHRHPGLVYLSAARSFSSRTTAREDQPSPDDIKDPPRTASREPGKPDSDSESAKASSEKSQKSSKAEEEDKDQEGAREKKEKKKDSPPPPPPPHGDKSPWQVFTDTLRSEFKASKEWNDSTKALASSAHQFTENESVKRARAAYTAASGTAASTTSSALKGTGKAIGKTAAWTWDTPVVKGVRAGVNATGKGLDKVTKPVRETAAFKSVKEVIDDGSSLRYGGWTEKEERRKKRELRELREAQGSGRPGKRVEKAEEDPNAGTNVTLHKDAGWKESWRDFKDSNRLMQSLFSLKSSYNESENPFISTARSISDRVAGFFAENETARVIKKFREMDPNFQIEPFLQEMREYILPEVLDAYVKGDIETLRLWLSAAQFQVYAAVTDISTKAGLKLDGRILDIRGVDILQARMLEPGEVPVFVITCRAQEVHVYRQIKTNELAAGQEDRVQLVSYGIGVTRIPEDVNNPETRGWRLIELQKHNRDYI